MTVECHKLDFVGFPIGINMDDGADVARFEAVRRQRLSEDHSLVFFDHNGTISQWVGADQPRSLEALVDDPNASNGGVLACRTRKRAFDHIFRAVGSQNNVLHIVDRCMVDQSVLEGDEVRDGESRTMEKVRLARSLRVVKGEEIARQLPLFNNRHFHIREPHRSEFTAGHRRGRTRNASMIPNSLRKWGHILTFDITPLGGRGSWHHCPECDTRPKTNRVFWDRKRETNIARDRRALWIATRAE